MDGMYEGIPTLAMLERVERIRPHLCQEQTATEHARPLAHEAPRPDIAFEGERSSSPGKPLSFLYQEMFAFLDELHIGSPFIVRHEQEDWQTWTRWNEWDNWKSWDNWNHKK